MTSESPADGIPDLLLERYALDELPRAEKAAIERRLDADPALRSRLDAIRRSDEETRDSGFPASLAHQVQARLKPRPAVGRATILRWAVPVAVSVAVLAVVVSLRGGVGPESPGERVKGLRPSLAVFRQTARGSEALADGARAREGDLLRLGYQAAGRTYGVIVSIDGRGAVTVHLPPVGGRAARLEAGDRVLLDHAYELDDAPRWECFYFLTSDRSFDVQPIVDEAKREARLFPASPPSTLALARGLEQSRFVLEKQEKP